MAASNNPTETDGITTCASLVGSGEGASAWAQATHTSAANAANVSQTFIEEETALDAISTTG